MKKIFIVFCVLSMLLCNPIRAFAYSDENTESIAQSAKADEIKNEYLTDDEINGDKTINLFEKALKIISDTLSDGGITVLKSFGAILGVILICCVMSSMKFSESQSLDSAIGFVSVLALSGVTYSVMYNLFVYVIASMEALTIAMSSLMPIMATLNAFGGNNLLKGFAADAADILRAVPCRRGAVECGFKLDDQSRKKHVYVADVFCFFAFRLYALSSKRCFCRER